MRIAIMFLFVLYTTSVHAIYSESLPVDLTLRVNVKNPVCKLDNGDLEIDFNNFEAFDVIQKSVTRRAIFNFSDCSDVENLKISFNGVNGTNIDLDKNLVRNLETDERYASGIGIKLYDNNRDEVQLNDTMNIPINKNNSYSLNLDAVVVPLNDSGKGITTGELSAFVELHISYE